jgi:hypothetical protein
MLAPEAVLAAPEPGAPFEVFEMCERIHSGR